MSSLLITPAAAGVREGRAKEFWRAFTSDTRRPKFVFGCNVYAESVANACLVDGFIDDFARQPTFCERPIVRTADIPKDALVLAASGGRPLTVRRKLLEMDVEQIDYFSLRRWTDADLVDIVFNEGFEDEFAANEAQYRWIHDRLADEASRDVFRKLVSFRLEYNLDVLEGFTDRQKEQYFEDFLQLRPGGETFVDVGCFDGFTTLEFIKRSPDYRTVYCFEPDPANFANCQRKLEGRPNITLLPLGAADRKGTLSFSMAGSASGVSADGELTIDIARIDDVVAGTPTFIKMDTEGSEAPALIGAERTIASYAPRLAISVYHKPGDFWRIPKLVLGMHGNYEIYMRHYTECIYETVMFFVPRSASG